MVKNKPKISVVINTLNEEVNIKRVLNSVKGADEIVICDMYSDDKTIEYAKEYTKKIVYHKKTSYVEPARNYAINQAVNEWVLLLDADEEISADLLSKLYDIASDDTADYVLVPRKNLIFNKWIKNSNWWPDYNIRFFKKEFITWKEEIHSKPETKGREMILPQVEEFALIHYHYQTVSQFLSRLDRYTTIQAKDLQIKGYKFNWIDLLRVPVEEFLSRFFANKGYLDGLHGLVLSILQAFSFFIVYIKTWENNGFPEEAISLKKLEEENKDILSKLKYWFNFIKLSDNRLIRFVQKTKNLILP